MKELFSVIESLNKKVLREELPGKLNALELFDLFSEDDKSCLLHSSLPDSGENLSYIALSPYMDVTSYQTESFVRIKDLSFKTDENPFTVLENILSPLRIDSAGKDHFAAGCLGYFSYDLKDRIEVLPRKAEENPPLPLMHLVFPRVILANNKKNKTKWTMRALCADLSENETLRLLSGIKRRVLMKKNHNEKTKKIFAGKIVSNFTRDSYIKKSEKVLDYIREGDIYQVCLSQRFSCRYKEKSFPLFRRLQEINPSPYAAYLNFPEVKVLSSSPELFIKCTKNHTETHPMKGTRRRGTTPEKDRKMKEELMKSEKDNAELSMIVDLERNDLGKFCRPGTVEVTEHRKIETYPTVHQTISTVTGKRKPEVSLPQVIKDIFPGGSITGCPKIRAMGIIDELEPVKRNIYTGSIGYISLHDTMQLNIAIRTMLKAKKHLYFQTGGGIVAGSDPEKEYEETMDKAEAMFECLK